MREREMTLPPQRFWEGGVMSGKCWELSTIMRRLLPLLPSLILTSVGVLGVLVDAYLPPPTADERVSLTRD